MTNYDTIKNSILEIKDSNYSGEEKEIKLDINELKAIYKERVRNYYQPQNNKHYEPTIQEMLWWLLQEVEE